MDSQRIGMETWKRMPLSSSVFFFLGVFCIFGALVLIGSSDNFESQTVADVLEKVLLSGGFAIIWAFLATRGKYWLFAVLFPLQFVANRLLA